jgi:uncharacterized OB-fold protein
MPVKSSVPLSWRLNRARYRMIATRCNSCQELFFPPRSICPKCRRKGKTDEVQLSGEGEIYSYTIIYTAPEGFEEHTPYILGIIKLKEGALATGQIVSPSNEVAIGKKVKMVFRKISEDGDAGIINYGFKFEVTG